ncbi:MAG: GWxTD domain-containing protein, partial [Balneolaceae bacterium]
SGKQTVRESSTVIPDPKEPFVNLTSVRLLGKEIEAENRFFPITTYDVPGKIDSLQFVFQVTNNDMDDPLNIRTRVIKFQSDSSIARPMNYNDYNVSSMPYRGIDYNRYEEIESTIRRLDQPGSVLIEFNFGRFPRGNYRFEVEADRNEEETIFKARDFGVKSENYPAVKSARELAQPLFYLMGNREYERLMQIQNPDSLKEAIDRFWLSNVRSVSDAKNVIALYYERVEEANKQFSNFKEGWKTDTGMIYILFGPPWFVETSINQMLWSYSYDRSDPRYNYFFERPKMPNEFFPFNNYLLDRNQQYFNVQYQQIQRWLSGDILRRGI